MWSGPTFYPVDKSYSWLPRGTYRAQNEGKSHYGRWDGKAFIELPSGKKQKQDDSFATVVALSGTKLDAYIAQISLGEEKKGAVYGLVVRNGDAWTYVFPDCATTRKIVIDAGGIMDGPSGLRKEAENVSMANLEAESVPLSAHRRAKRHKSSRPILPAKPLSVAPADRAQIVQADPTEDEADRYGGQTCHFPTQASLEEAARRYLAERQLIGDKVVRIGD